MTNLINPKSSFSADMLSKLIFTFATEASPLNPKTTVLHVKCLQFTEDGPRYLFPSESQDIAEHEELMKTAVARSVRKSIGQVRGKFRTVKISLSTDLYSLYVDDDGNPLFKDYLLDQGYPTSVDSSSSSSSVVRDRDVVPEKSLSSIVKDAVLQKFGSRRMNASSWIDTFELECLRLGILENRFWEAVRLFLEGAALDWYDSRRLTFSGATWAKWRESFLDSFAPKGWSDARSAISYRYFSGSLSEYAIKKENLLINFHSKMDDVMKITLIILGLPISIQEKIDPSEISSVGKLLSKLNSFDRPRSFSSAEKSNLSPSPFSSIKSRSPCPYCLKKGFQHFHAEKDCRIKLSDIEKAKKPLSAAPKARVNNVEINDLLNQVLENQKSE